ncbi:MAG: WbqC family protein [Synechococcus sp. MIT S9220]|uniref:WbqC family protein n=1 Tax=unclassified Synechococcus TaxID=2626047 RepID=UPI00164B5A95|nr:WbqC family protein [Synechococcus sp. MIT S9220]NOL48023.1 WbqC family protein [Synechococcus sp. MIT S9220]
MKVSINQPAYLPWPGYFDRINKADLHIVLDHVQFEKNSFVNRNKVLQKNTPILLTVPIKTKGSFGNLAINNLEIDNSKNWRRKHHQTIYACYKKTEYFAIYKDFVDNLFSSSHSTFSDILSFSQDNLLEYLGITTPIVYSSTLDVSSTKSNLILDLCKMFNTTEYLSGPYGINYLDEDSFTANGISVSYHHYMQQSYPQGTGNFIPNLSILDMIFNCGPNSFQYLPSLD